MLGASAAAAPYFGAPACAAGRVGFTMTARVLDFHGMCLSAIFFPKSNT